MSGAASARSGSFSIGEVLARLRPEFPDVTISKIRFLEAEGLVEPERAPSGYRKFGHDDIERLRFVLTAQRDHYLPLRVIKEHLAALDAGLTPPNLPSGEGRVQPAPRIVDDEGTVRPSAFRPSRSDVRWDRQEVIELAGIKPELFEQLESYGLVTARPGRDLFDEDALAIAKVAGELAGFGLEPRHLRAFRTAADRQVGLIEQVTAPLVRHRAADSRARAEEHTRELAALSVQLHALLVKAGLHG
ncbi:transcriptional regulator FtsR [Actinopolymorpha singaporensis]|uniref:MerR family regulatory protein n=1 Tax=Actinopolymorpha singaporensis TaxID=117157 RepID=A0A1H1WWD6_9ACTN|nr:MerR family transcriptional regulator [Actinopolymorpha singaporensis]SDT01483.1 MerR family regulatory protein [Actinopolymorpha singaporensis]